MRAASSSQAWICRGTLDARGSRKALMVVMVTQQWVLPAMMVSTYGL